MPETRTDLALPRFFAVIFFLAAGMIGLPLIPIALGVLVTGKWSSFCFFLVILPVAWWLYRLGMILWAGEPLPQWLITAFCVTTCIMPVVALLVEGYWFLGGVAAFMLSPMLLLFRSNPYSGKSLKPQGFDELA